MGPVLFAFRLFMLLTDANNTTREEGKYNIKEE